MIKKHYKWQKIDFTIPYDTRVDDKEVEKTEKYLDLAKELKRAWIMKVTVVLLVTGALDTAAEALEKKLNNIGIEKKITELQKAILKHPAEYCEKFLSCEESCWHHTSKINHICC